MTQISYKDVARLESLVRSLQGVVDRLKSTRPVVADAQRARIENFRKESRCLVCEQPIIAGEEVRRGSHQACHNRIAMEIKLGKRTEQEAVDSGEWNPVPEAPGRKPKYGRRREVVRAVGALKDAADRDKRRDKKAAKAKESR